MKAPLHVVACVPTAGEITLRNLQRHIEGCSCRRRHPSYTVFSFEHKMPLHEGYTTEVVIERALLCAQAALNYHNRTVIGIGFDRGKTMLKVNKRPIITPVAVAVLLLRTQPTAPRVVLSTADDGSEYAAELLDLCQKEGFKQAHSGHGTFIERAVREALSA